MANIALRVNLWGRCIGYVSYSQGDKTASFEYDRDFINSGIEVAPLMMPLAEQIYSFPELSYETFSGLPGMLADSLPDKFGNAIINRWIESQGRDRNSMICHNWHLIF